jgi:hypothetical protein
VEDRAGAWSATEVWTSRGLKPNSNDLAVHRGTARGFDGNVLAAIDVATGQRAWKGGRHGNGQMLLLADQFLLLVNSVEGELGAGAGVARAVRGGHPDTALEGGT